VADDLVHLHKLRTGLLAAAVAADQRVVALKDVLSTPAVGSIFNHVLGPPSDAEPESASG